MVVQGLNKTQLDTYDREGMLCIPDFLTLEECKALRSRSYQMLEEFDIASHPKTQFKTGENDHVGDEYFFNSSDKVGFFFDVDAFDDKGNLKFSKEKAINKIGHGLHMQDKLFHDITFKDDVKDVVRSFGYRDPRVLQSMCIFKQPVEGSEKERENAVPSHTDGTFLFTKPQSAIGFWFALEDCTKENGCLAYNPGTHKTHPIEKRFVKINKGQNGCNFIPVDHEVTSSPPADIDEDYKYVECKAGSLILIHNSVLHKSANNRSRHSRFAYAFHVIEGETEYDNLNWLQVPPSPEGGTYFSQLYNEE